MAIEIPDSLLGSEAPRPQAGASPHCTIISYCAPLDSAYKAGARGPFRSNAGIHWSASYHCLLEMAILFCNRRPTPLKTQRNLR